MKIVTYILFAFLFSCNTVETPKEGQTKIIAVYTHPTDGVKIIDVLIRQIYKVVKYDSTSRKDKISIDTLWGYPVIVPLRDSLGKALVDSSGKTKTGIGYAVIGKDSVNWKVENISTDSLLKK